jgi:hypothetical protein
MNSELVGLNIECFLKCLTKWESLIFLIDLVKNHKDDQEIYGRSLCLKYLPMACWHCTFDVTYEPQGM